MMLLAQLYSDRASADAEPLVPLDFVRPRRFRRSEGAGDLLLRYGRCTCQT